MKTVKSIIALLVMLVMILSLSACKKDDAPSIIGTWSVNREGILSMTGLTQEEYDNFVQMGVEQTVTMEYNNEGIVAITMSVAGQYVKDFLPYEIKEGKLYVDGDPADYVIKGNEMTITQDDIKIVLTKVDK